MLASIQTSSGEVQVDLSQPLDISMPLDTDPERTSAWYVSPPTMEPVMTDRFTGLVAKGGAVNFRNIRFNPHGNGTHTECVGHIAQDIHSINQCLGQFFFVADLRSLEPEVLATDRGAQKAGDRVLTMDQIKTAFADAKGKAVIIRTLPNTEEKLKLNYSNTNPPYLDHEAAAWLRDKDVEHLLLDLPSVDRENDDGKLISHHTFWNYPEAPRMSATISELIFVPESIPDGTYLLNLMVAPFENDASPSKPILYKIRN